MAGPRKRFTFKGIEEIGIAALNNLHEARQEVEREEQRPPALVLSNVDMFVPAMMGKCGVVHADDDVADRHGAEAATAR